MKQRVQPSVSIPLVAAVLLASAGCRSGTPGATPALSLAVMFSPVTFTVLPPRVPPGSSAHPCCATLAASWSLSVASTRSGDLDSATITIRDGATGALVVSQSLTAAHLAAQGHSHVEAGTPSLLSQSVLQPVPADFSAASLVLRIEVTLRAGSQQATGSVETSLVTPG
jgi:hypothetical protein